LLDGGARYHLYFLLVTMQLYLIFPLLLWLLKRTRGHHLALLGISFALQLAFTFAFHYRLLGAVPGTDVPTGWLDHPDQWLLSYQFYVIAGAVAAAHLEEITAWILEHRRVVAWLVAATFAGGMASYAFDVVALQIPTGYASEVFQPAIVIESVAAVAG